MVTRKSRPGFYILPPLFLLAVYLLVAVCPAAAAIDAGGRSPRADTEASGEATPPPIAAQLQELAQSDYGSYGIYLNILETGEQAGYAENETFYAASCYKLFLVMYIYESAARGEIDLNRSITYQGGDMEGETGVIQTMPLGTAFTTRELCMYAIVHSDNVAARMLKRVYGYRTFRDYATSIGCPVAGTYNIDSTTAREMGILLMRVLQFAAVDPLGQEVITYLKESRMKSRIPAGLPAGVEVGNKTGDYQGCYNDVAIVFLDDLTYVLCVLSKDGSYDSVHSEASRLVYEDIYRRHYGGGSCSTCSYQPATQWWFAQAPTVKGYETWLCLTNSDTSVAVTSVRSMGGQGAPVERTVCIPSRSVMSLRLNQLCGAGQELALSVSSGSPILAERVTYCDRQGDWKLADSKAGMTQAASDWCFATGGPDEGEEAWLYLFNPGAAATGCTVTILTGGGQSQRLPVALPAQGKSSLPLSGVGGGAPDVALCVLADAPVLVEEIAYPR
jgi:beta-lactamase class A